MWLSCSRDFISTRTRHTAANPLSVNTSSLSATIQSISRWHRLGVAYWCPKHGEPFGKLFRPSVSPSLIRPRFAFDKASKAVRDRLADLKTTEPQFATVYARNTPCQPLHRAAAIRQSQSRWYTTSRAINSAFERSVRQLSTSAKAGAKIDRFSFPKSRTATAVRQLTARTPFASTLRPNLTGGTLSRTAGGYGLGSGRVGGARYFSHAPAAQAQVVNNVSAAVRAFWISGQKVQYDGVNPQSGKKRYKAVSSLQHEASQKMRLNAPSGPGSFIDFKTCPTITAVGRVANAAMCDYGLTNESLHDLLSTDFARALKDLAIIKTDLSRLSALGDLPISLINDSTIRVRFSGCDAETVERLCNELGVRRGVVKEDPEFDTSAGVDMALLFPFAPSRPTSDMTCSPAPRNQKYPLREELTWDDMFSPDQPIYPPSESSHDFEEIDLAAANPWANSLSGYSSLQGTDVPDDALFEHAPRSKDEVRRDAAGYEGVEGIYRFLAECDSARRAPAR